MCERYCDNSCAAKVEILNDFIDEFGDVLERKVLLSNFPDEHAKMDKLSILFMNFKCQFNKIFDFKESSDSINDNKPSSNISNVTCNANQNNLLTEEMLDELKSMNRSIIDNRLMNMLNRLTEILLKMYVLVVMVSYYSLRKVLILS